MTEPSTPAASALPEGDSLTFQPGDSDEDDQEFQPRQSNRLHWLTLLLIALAIWGAGFLVGVLTDRAVAGITG